MPEARLDATCSGLKEAVAGRTVTKEDFDFRIMRISPVCRWISFGSHLTPRSWRWQQKREAGVECWERRSIWRDWLAQAGVHAGNPMGKKPTKKDCIKSQHIADPRLILVCLPIMMIFPRKFEILYKLKYRRLVLFLCLTHIYRLLREEAGSCWKRRNTRRDWLRQAGVHAGNRWVGS